jgi:hypothetical protein
VARVLPDHGEPSLQSLRFDRRERHPIHTRSSPVRASQLIGVGQNVFAMDLVVEQVETKRRFRLRFAIQLLLKTPDIIWCCQAHRQSPILVPVTSAPEVRVLPSVGITRPHRYHDPVRLPLRAVANCDVGDAISTRCGSPPITRNTFPACRAHYPGGSRRVLMSVASLSRAAFPESQTGRHPQFHFRGLLRLHLRYRLPDRSTALGGLCRKAPTRPVAQTGRLPATRSNRLLSGWYLPPLVFRAFGAH